MLFLDEVALYRAEVLDSLRGPLEERMVRIARSGGVVTFPCSFSLVAAMNPCPYVVSELVAIKGDGAFLCIPPDQVLCTAQIGV